MEQFLTIAQDAFMWMGIVVTAATSIVAALEKVAAVTPTTKDDEYVSKAKVALGYVSTILDKVSVWTTKK